MRVAIACDHSAFACKQALVPYIERLGHEVLDMGCCGTVSVDYPEYALKVARAVAAGEAERGVLICATGIGMSIAANKVDGIRCALCADPVSARLTRAHNDSNVLALGALVCGQALTEGIVGVWLQTGFSDEERHQRRIDAIAEIERTYL